MDLSIRLSTPGLADWVYDPGRDLIHSVTSTGLLYSWNIGQQRWDRYAVQLGEPLSSVDISPDGGHLLIGRADRILTSGDPNSHFVTYADLLLSMDLRTETTQEYRFEAVYHEGGVGELAIGEGGKALLTTYSTGSGSTPLRLFDPNPAGSRTIIVDNRGLGASTLQSSALIVSEDRRYILVQEVNSSLGGLSLWDARTETMVGHADAHTLGVGSGYQNGLGDVSSAAGLVVDIVNGKAYLLDLGLRLIATIGTFDRATAIIGAQFNDGGHQIFLWQGEAEKVVVLDALTRLPVGSFDVLSITGPGYNGAPYGEMDVASNGRVLILDNGLGLELIDLSTRLHITINGDATDQTLHGAIGGDSLSGAGGADTVNGYAGEDYLRGDEGNDVIAGGADFDDINGNMGDDTAAGGAGDDWVVGGKDNDRLSGEVGDDIVYGNLGNDICNGGDGADLVRGGQGNDTLSGGAANDWLSGDRGDDTITGGAGADIFHGSQDAGIDRVTDFNRAEGDRVQLDAGTTYTLRQVGADTVLDMGGGHQMILVGVQMSSLTSGWVFGA